MIPDEYEAIASRCDQLLRARGSSLERIAIPLLHVVCEHPRWISQYAPVLDAYRAGHSLPPRRPSADVRTVARVTRALWRSLGHPVRLTSAGALAPVVDVLIVSHLGGPAQMEQSGDFYFGDLQQLLDERGVTSALVYVDHLRSRDARRAFIERLACARRVLLPRSLPLLVESRIWRRCFAAAASLRREVTGRSMGASRRGRGGDNPLDELHSLLASLASHHVLYEATVANLRLHESVARCCLRVRPRIVITTHEGDAGDRLIWHAARSVDPSILCVGYQHTRIFARAHAIRRPLRVAGTRYDPDVILTVGEFSRCELAKCAELAPVRLITYGSHRRPNTPALMPFGIRPRACVVLPDAYELESVLLFGFALDCARVCPEVTFVLRPHPVIDFAALCSRHPVLRMRPGNVSISTRTLEQECQAARYCLYRGSSAVVSAVLSGLKPFYLACAGELPFDPLYALGEWREVVSSIDQFLSRIAAADVATSREVDAADRARQLCDRYVSPVRPQALEELLELGLQSTRPIPSGRAVATPLQ